MFNKDKFKFFCKLIIILGIIIFSITFISSTLSRYKSVGTSNADIDIAYYLVDDTSISQTLNTGSILPRTEPYTYNILVANNDGTKRTDTALEYDMTIRTTTNIPLQYRVYLNETYTDANADDIIVTNVVARDGERADDTYFRTITLPTGSLGCNSDEANTYQLVINFPAEYNTSQYQNILEYIEITINSRQKI